MPKHGGFFMLQKFMSETGIITEEKYISNATKMKWSCPEGHTFITSWKVMNRRKCCLICNDKRRKNTFEDILKFFKENNAELLTQKKDFQNGCDQKLEILCSKSHKIQKTFKAYRKHGCSICNPKKEKYDINELKQIALKRGDILLSNEYIDAHTPLIFKCKHPEHEPYESLWTTYNRDNERTNGSFEKTQCRKCAYESLKVSSNILKKQILAEDYDILEMDETAIHSKYDFLVQCPKKHIPYITTWNRWQQGKRCLKCSPMSLKSIDDVKQILATKKLMLVDDEYSYAGNKAPLKAICQKNHITWKTLQGFERYGCSECSTAGTSSVEFEIIDYFQKYNPIHRYKHKGMEIDIYFEEHKLALEYCGLYWHGSKRIKSLYWDDPDELNRQLYRNIYRHQQKRTKCIEAGITLLTIFEDEFLDKKDIVLSRISHKLGVSKKIYARNCIISDVSKDEANEFFKSYHLQENTPFDYGMKLVYDNQIIAVMTFGQPLTYNRINPNDWELKRYCCLPHIQIVGGANRLFKHSLIEAKNKGIPSIFTYCDLRWGTGNVYKTLGFELLKDSTKPSPHTIKGIKRIRSRNTTDEENLIYDCGHQKWLFKLD